MAQTPLQSINLSLQTKQDIFELGELDHYVWSVERRDWFTAAEQPSDPDFCAVEAKCGAHACRCLEGFAPRVEGDWDLFDFSQGCVRERALQCEKEKTVFSRVSSAVWSGGLNGSGDGECEALCLDDCSCSCSAFANRSGDGCVLFKDDLMDLQRLGNQSSAGGDLFVRMERADRPSRKGKKKVVVAVAVSISAAALVVLSFCLWPILNSKVFRGGASRSAATRFKSK